MTHNTAEGSFAITLELSTQTDRDAYAAKNAGEQHAIKMHLLSKLREVTDALAPLMDGVYARLLRIAGGYLRDERNDHTLDAASLVHEAFLRLVGLEAPWRHRGHFYAVAAGTMRRVLVDYARRRDAAKPTGSGCGRPARTGRRRSGGGRR